MTKLSLRARFAIALSLHGVALAQAWPTRPVRFIVGNGAGGSDDFHARTLAPKLADLFGQQFVVDNRPGAGSLIAQTAVVNAPNHGHTILLAAQGAALRHFFEVNMPFDPMRAFRHRQVGQSYKGCRHQATVMCARNRIGRAVCTQVKPTFDNAASHEVARSKNEMPIFSRSYFV